MMSFNGRAKSTVLALAMIVSVVECNPLVDAVLNNKTACSTLAVVLMILKVRLDTKPRCHYTFENWQSDVTGLFNAYNIFNPASRVTIMNFLDKYFVGSKFKRVDTTTRTKEEDGSVFTITGTKVVQKPTGFMGLLDAYVLMQMKGFTDNVPVLAGLYLLINDPCGVFAREIAKQTK